MIKLAIVDDNIFLKKALAEKLRQRIKILSSAGSATISASFGVATLGNESIEKLIKRVDEALYRAKQNGRDRVEASERSAYRSSTLARARVADSSSALP